MTHRRAHTKAFDPFGLEDKKRQSQRAQTRVCDHPGCDLPGEHRAPKDRTLSDYLWLCLDHVRQHNQRWNFYQGMSAEEMEDEIRRDSCWQRPTWKLGTLGAQGPGSEAWGQHVRDDLGIFAEDQRKARAERQRRQADAERRARQEQRQRRAGGETQGEWALRILDIEPPFDRDQLRRRYLTLVKEHHPDVNQGDPLAEDRLKDINEAYKILQKALNA